MKLTYLFMTKSCMFETIKRRYEHVNFLKQSCGSYPPPLPPPSSLCAVLPSPRPLRRRRRVAAWPLPSLVCCCFSHVLRSGGGTFDRLLWVVRPFHIFLTYFRSKNHYFETNQITLHYTVLHYIFLHHVTLRYVTRSERSTGPMLNATFTPAEASCSTQLHNMLVMLCKGTALTRVVNAGAQEGLDAWRFLVLHHEPTSLTRSAGLLQELLNFSFAGETAARMAQFDRDIDRNQKANGETFPESIRVGVALRMLLDGRLKQHLVLDSARLTTWETLKAEIDNVSVWHTESGFHSEGPVARQRKRQCSKDAMPDLRQGWSNEERVLLQHSPWLGGNEQAQKQEKGQRRHGQDSCQ